MNRGRQSVRLRQRLFSQCFNHNWSITTPNDLKPTPKVDKFHWLQLSRIPLLLIPCRFCTKVIIACMCPELTPVGKSKNNNYLDFTTIPGKITVNG